MNQCDGSCTIYGCGSTLRCPSACTTALQAWFLLTPPPLTTSRSGQTHLSKQCMQMSRPATSRHIGERPTLHLFSARAVLSLCDCQGATLSALLERLGRMSLASSSHPCSVHCVSCLKVCCACRFDVSKLEPVVAAPHSPDNRKLARECSHVKIDRVYIGCAEALHCVPSGAPAGCIGFRLMLMFAVCCPGPGPVPHPSSDAQHCNTKMRSEVRLCPCLVALAALPPSLYLAALYCVAAIA